MHIHLQFYVCMWLCACVRANGQLENVSAHIAPHAGRQTASYSELLYAKMRCCLCRRFGRGRAQCPETRREECLQRLPDVARPAPSLCDRRLFDAWHVIGPHHNPSNVATAFRLATNNSAWASKTKKLQMRRIDEMLLKQQLPILATNY